MYSDKRFNVALYSILCSIPGAQSALRTLSKLSLKMSCRPLLQRVGLSAWATVILLCIPVLAQDELPNPSTLPGPQAYTTVASDTELVNNANGSVFVSIPLLHLPGINGFDLNLAVNYTSKHWDLYGYVREEAGGFETTRSASLNWANIFSYTKDFGEGTLSVPRLLYGNFYLTTTYDGTSGYYQPVYCASGFIYMEENGGMHTFLNRRDCYPINPGSGYPTINISDSEDTSLIRLDTTSLADMKVYLKNGNIVHFSGTQTPFGSVAKDDDSPIYPSYIEDPNGNQITFTKTKFGLDITDSLGRVVSMRRRSSIASIWYADSSGIARGISISSNTAPGNDVTLSASQCSGPYWNNHTTTIPSTSTTDLGSNNIVDTIVLGSGGSGRRYSVTSDSAGEPIEVKFPSGGYTHYAYQTFQGQYRATQFMCFQYDVREVSQKSTCKSSSGSCGQEDTTTYTPVLRQSTNDSIAVLEPPDTNGQQRKTVFTYSPTIASNRFASSHETERSIYANQTNLVEKVTTQYLDDLASHVDSGYLSVMALPQTITTVKTQSGGSLSTTTSMQYDSKPLTNVFFTNQGSETYHIDNLTQTAQSDFSGNTLKTTSNVWNYIGPHIWNRVLTTTVSGSGISRTNTFGYDGKGNVTSSSVEGTNLAPLTTTYQVNSYGQTTQVTDPKGNATKLAYTNAWSDGICAVPSTTANGPSSIIDPLGHETSFLYYSCSGRVESTRDPNAQKTSYTYDPLGRTKSVQYPDQGKTTYGYTDEAPNSILITKQLSASGSPGPMVIEETMDGLGRPSQHQLQSDPAGITYVDTAYDALGRVATISNPYRSQSESTYGLTSYVYDALGRKTKQTNPDSSTEQWCYDGVSGYGCSANASQGNSSATWVDFTDESGHHWQRTSDAFGRLTGVMEPDASTGSLAYETDYTYDALNNLTQVNQQGDSKHAKATARLRPSPRPVTSSSGRQRSFTYDSLSRLITASNPETGTICYGIWSGSSCVNGYDANGNLIAKTDARGAVTNYAYDALNRITTKSYPTVPSGVAPTSPVHYFYDAAVGGWGWPDQISPVWQNVSQTNLIGRLSSVSVGEKGANAWTLYGYDAMGRTVLKSECLPIDCGNNHHDSHYKYDLAGNMTFYDRSLDVARNNWIPGGGFYFGGFTQAYDAAGHLVSVTGDTTGTNHATNILSNTSYYPNGQLQSATQIGLYNITKSADNRGRYTGFNVTNSSNQLVWSGSTTWNPDSTVKATTDIYAGAWSYEYDSLGRISKASGPTGSTQYSIDPYGNKYQQTTLSGSAPSPSYGVAGTNALTGNGLTYDGSGNVTYDGLHQYTYDAEGRLYSVDGTTCYTYDGDGDRVATTNCNVVNAGNGSTSGINTEFFYDFNHRLMAQINVGSEQIQRANIYAGEEFLAEDSPDPFLTATATATQLRITDQVGSLRSLQDLGNPKGLWPGAWRSFPYGDGATAGDGGDSGDLPGGMLFTGKMKDPESTLDYFGARYYNSNMGRFMSPDDSSDQDPADPQSWNLYSYVRNNPLSNTDPDGHSVDLCTPTASGHEQCVLLSNDQYTSGQRGNNSGLNVPTLDQVGMNGNGSGQFNATAITDSNGNSVGTATYVSDGGADYYANRNGYQQLSAASTVVKSATVAVGVTFGAVAAAAAAPEVAAAVGRSGIRFVLQHGMRWEAGHSMVMATASEVKVAVGAAVTAGIASGEFQQGVIKGQTMVNGTIIAFTGFMNSTGQVVIKNVMGGFNK